MSNEHDPQEPTGARLTEAQVAQVEAQADLLAALTWTCDRYSPEIEEVPYPLEPLGKVVFTFLTPQPQATSNALLSLFKQGVFALLADRAARVAEVARLQAEKETMATWAAKAIQRLSDDLYYAQREANKLTVERDAAEAQVAAMRPLVEAHANLVDVNIDDELACAACERWLGPGKPHAPDCSKVAARALVATWQPPAAPRLTGGERIQALREAQAAPTTGEITAIMVSRLDETPTAPDALYIVNPDDGYASGGGMQTLEPPAAPTPDGAIIIPDDPREQARIQREIILDSGVDFAEHYAGLVDDPTDDDDAPTPDGQEGGDA